METTVASERSRLRRHPERAVDAEAAAFLDAGSVAHVGFVVDGQPYVVPFSYQYASAEPDRLYLHGSLDSRALAHLASGAPVCVTVTLEDALVYSRTAMYHSMNYRSVVAFGRARAVDSADDKQAVFLAMVERYFPGRTAGRDYEAAPRQHLDATALIEVRLEEVSAKRRTGGPLGPHDADPAAPGTCGLVPLHP
jgi:nitroimidazol reductase NimA-like FMN-containing flavoprotein (pyridoxamine 5'-phosphate oxidase superfamily)